MNYMIKVIDQLINLSKITRQINSEISRRTKKLPNTFLYATIYFCLFLIAFFMWIISKEYTNPINHQTDFSKMILMLVLFDMSLFILKYMGRLSVEPYELTLFPIHPLLIDFNNFTQNVISFKSLLYIIAIGFTLVLCFKGRLNLYIVLVPAVYLTLSATIAAMQTLLTIVLGNLADSKRHWGGFVIASFAWLFMYASDLDNIFLISHYGKIISSITLFNSQMSLNNLIIIIITVILATALLAITATIKRGLR